MSDITIGEFAKLTRCTSKTILYYHKIGLLQTPRRSTNGYWNCQ
nr:MerR family DNA-binding transcriptional regulator [Acetobacterium wieringae]